MHYYPFNPSAYYLSTGHWSEDRTEVPCEAGLLRDLAYRRLLDLYYGEEEPIPSKTRLVAIRIRMLKHEDIVASVLREKFTLIEGFWRQERADLEVSKYQRRAAASRENGRKGGRPKTQPEPGKTQQVASGLQLRTRTRTKKNTPLPPEGEVWWGEFWQAYPRKEAKQEALKAFAKALAVAPSFAAIMEGLRRFIGCDQWTSGDETKIPHAATWLSGERWNDTPAKAGGTNGKSSANWWDTRQGILDKGITLGLSAPGDLEGPSFWEYTAAVWAAMGDGPWIDNEMQAYRYYVRMRDNAEGSTT